MAIGDVSVPAELGDRVTVAHGWSSTALTPYVLSAGRPPAGPDEVVTGYPATLGARLTLAATEPARTVTVVGVARPRHPVSQQTAIFLTDAEAMRLAGQPGRVDAIGVLAAPGFDAGRLRAAAGGAQVLTGGARGAAEYPELELSRTTLIPVTAAFGGLAMFIAIFVVASTLLVLTVALSCTPFLQQHHHRPRHHPATAGGADRTARHHQRRAGPAGRRAGRHARHARSTLGGRADVHHARPEPWRR